MDSIRVNGREVALPDDHRVSLLDLLRDRAQLCGTKKGCDQGACGACTVLVDGERVLSCLTLARQVRGEVTTIEGLATDGALHPLQQLFVDCDGFQCGYCTPGQICSAVGMVHEHKAGMPSVVTANLTENPELTDHEIRERMSGNICRCAAYPNIVAAIKDAAGETL